MSRPILTQDEVKEYVTWILLAFRRDLSREMEACGESLEITGDFSAMLYELTGRFELEPGQRSLVCSPEVCLLYDPPDESLVVRQPPAASLVAQPAVALN